MEKCKIFIIISNLLLLMKAECFSIHSKKLDPLKKAKSLLSIKSSQDRSRRQWIEENFFILTQAASLSPNLKKAVSKSLIFTGVVQTKFIPPTSAAAETLGKDENCNNPQCLGVWGGLLANCPHDKLPMTMGAGCASSQDDTPGVFAEPWDYSEAINLDWKDQMSRLVLAIQVVSSKRGDDMKILIQEKRYIRVLFTDGKTNESSVGEFYFTPDDTTVQFRVGSLLATSSNPSMLSTAASVSSMKNLERCEAIRKQLGYLKLPILRNRKRLFFFGESQFDSFGPGSASIGSPAEMRKDELDGLPEFDPNLKTDLSQNFPFSVDR